MVCNFEKNYEIALPTCEHWITNGPTFGNTSLLYYTDGSKTDSGAEFRVYESQILQFFLIQKTFKLDGIWSRVWSNHYSPAYNHWALCCSCLHIRIDRNIRRVSLIVGFSIGHYRLMEHLRKLQVVRDIVAECHFGEETLKHILIESDALAGTRRHRAWMEFHLSILNELHGNCYWQKYLYECMMECGSKF